MKNQTTQPQKKKVRIRRKDGLYFVKFLGKTGGKAAWSDKAHAEIFPSRNQAKLVRDQLKEFYGPSLEVNFDANFVEEQ